MSKIKSDRSELTSHKWAAIIYGRTYHIDFRFITIPQDFTTTEKNWAAQYILSTFRQANKLSASPRWSLFKNRSHCIVGVTCMVRDLLAGMDQSIIDLLSKDNRGRPLYIFVGYTTRLKKSNLIKNFPFYQDQYLYPFQNLYQQILQVWWLEEYRRNSKQPILDPYQAHNFQNPPKINLGNFDLARQINHQGKYPHQTYLWQNTPEQKQRLWITAAICNQPASICIGNQSIRDIINNSSPFLNQTVFGDSSKVLEGCAIRKIPNSKLKPIPKQEPIRPTPAPEENLTELIANKVKEDIEVTLHQAKKVGNQSRGIWRNLSKSKTSDLDNFEKIEKHHTNLSNSKRLDELKDFGFKTKSKSPPPKKSQSQKKDDWF